MLSLVDRWHCSMLMRVGVLLSWQNLLTFIVLASRASFGPPPQKKKKKKFRTPKIFVK